MKQKVTTNGTVWGPNHTQVIPPAAPEASKGEFMAEVAADPVYHLLGTDGIETDKWPPPGLPLVTTLGYFMHDGGHGTLPDDWQVFINFLNIQLRAKMN